MKIKNFLALTIIVLLTGAILTSPVLADPEPDVPLVSINHTEYK